MKVHVTGELEGAWWEWRGDAVRGRFTQENDLEPRP